MLESVYNLMVWCTIIGFEREYSYTVIKAPYSDVKENIMTVLYLKITFKNLFINKQNIHMLNGIASKKEKLEDNKGVIRSRKSGKDRQYNEWPKRRNKQKDKQ